MPLVPTVKEGDWVGLKKILQRVSSKLDNTASPTFYNLTLTNLTANSLIYPDSNKLLISLGAATDGQLPIGDTGGVPVLATISGTANEIDVTNGAGTITIGIVNPLIVAKGGSGAATFTDHSLLVGSGTGAFTAIGVAGNGYLPIGSAGADPVLASLTGTANQVIVTNAAGSITLSLPQDIHTAASPQFTGIELGHTSDTTITRVSAGVIAVEGTTVMMVGDAPTAHTHDGDTLQLDAINSNGGAFAFSTSGAITFNQNLILPDGGTVGQAAGPLLTFDDTNNKLGLTGGKLNIGDSVTASNATRPFNVCGTDAVLRCLRVHATAGAGLDLITRATSDGSDTGHWQIFTSASEELGFLDRLGGDVHRIKFGHTGGIFVKEQASAGTDIAAYGQLWVKTATPNTLWFTDDAGTDTQLGVGGLDIDGLGALTDVDVSADYYPVYDDSASGNKKVLVPIKTESSSRTVNLDNGMTTAEIQAEIDSIGKIILPGVEITVQFADGTYTPTATLYFGGFIGGGSLLIYGDTGETNATDLHTTQDVYLNFSGTNCNGLTITGNLCVVRVYNLKICAQTTSYRACIYSNSSSWVECRYNYLLGDATTQGWGLYCYSSSAQLLKTYVSTMKHGIEGRYSKIQSHTNDDTGTQPLYGLYSANASVIHKYSTQPTGSTADELLGGGEIWS